MATLGSVTINLHLTTEIGGPIALADMSVNVPMTSERTPDGATLHIDQQILRHEIAAALIEAATKIDA